VSQSSSRRKPHDRVASVLTPEVIAAIGVESFLRPGGGQTSIVAPGGEYHAGPIENEEKLVCADVDLKRIDRGKSIVDTAGHYVRPDVVQLVRQSGRRRSIVEQ
jgi:aliphatic nitrilase